jgi:hypothetical protein
MGDHILISLLYSEKLKNTNNFNQNRVLNSSPPNILLRSIPLDYTAGLGNCGFLTCNLWLFGKYIDIETRKI